MVVIISCGCNNFIVTDVLRLMVYTTASG